MPAHNLGDGRYRLDRRLNEGGMGEVWAGWDTKLEREVAVKIIRLPGITPGKQHIQRFVRESRITARLQHPGVPAIFDGGTDDHGWPFLVMQKVEGLDIKQLLAKVGPLSIGWTAAIAAQICSVLAAAHAASLIHRDLKPSNVMLEPSGGVKVLDFGLATAPTLAEFPRITQTDQQLGSPAYMAPEQVNAHPCSPATDLYALGCTIHEMLTGASVFAGTSVSILIKHLNEAPAPLRSIRVDVPADLEKLVLDLLEKTPQARPADAETVYRRLAPFVTDLQPLGDVLTPPAEPSPARMHAGILSRVFPLGEPGPSVTREDIALAREQARQLVERKEFGPAASTLEEVARQARQRFGDTDADVLRVRQDLADALLEGGDYERAAPAFQSLAADFVTSGMLDPAFECRAKEATCASLLGHGSEALRLLRDLLADRHETHGEQDPRARDLRKQIGLLELGAGRMTAARHTLTDLFADLRRQPGPGPDPQQLADMIAKLWPLDPGWVEALKQVAPDEPSTISLLREVAHNGAPSPVIGYELGEEGWVAEAAWPEHGVAVLLAEPNDREREARDAAYRTAGWDARVTDRWKVAELIEALTRPRR